ncbi:MAG: DndE family protein [Candidatus Delongbacteria bacterium]|nr:DndE family protein [Candidatus Delongbacteria bacterium]
MNYRIYTSEETKNVLIKMRDTTSITPNILARYGIALSLKNVEPINLDILNFSNKGLELNRNVITSKYDHLFKALISQKEGRFLNDHEYFEQYLLAHIERGVKELYAEFQMAGNTEKFIKRLIAYEYGRDM